MFFGVWLLSKSSDKIVIFESFVLSATISATAFAAIFRPVFVRGGRPDFLVLLIASWLAMASSAILFHLYKSGLHAPFGLLVSNSFFCGVVFVMLIGGYLSLGKGRILTSIALQSSVGPVLYFISIVVSLWLDVLFISSYHFSFFLFFLYVAGIVFLISSFGGALFLEGGVWGFRFLASASVLRNFYKQVDVLVVSQLMPIEFTSYYFVARRSNSILDMGFDVVRAFRERSFSKAPSMESYFSIRNDFVKVFLLCVPLFFLYGFAFRVSVPEGASFILVVLFFVSAVSNNASFALMGPIHLGSVYLGLERGRSLALLLFCIFGWVFCSIGPGDVVLVLFYIVGSSFALTGVTFFYIWKNFRIRSI